jgi:hypothetical protein
MGRRGEREDALELGERAESVDEDAVFRAGLVEIGVSSSKNNEGQVTEEVSIRIRR